jgi:hypothetical protein
MNPYFQCVSIQDAILILSADMSLTSPAQGKSPAASPGHNRLRDRREEGRCDDFG